MKKILLVFILIVVGIPYINAQANGEKWIGGSIGFSTGTNNEDDRFYEYNITPEFGYILTDKFALGIAVGYSHNEKRSDSDVYKRDGFTVNPFVRYTFLKGNIGGLFIDGGAKYGYYKNSSEIFEYKQNELEIGFRPGVAIVLSQRISLTGRFGFFGYERQFSDGNYDDSFGFNLDMKDVSLGINVIF